MEYKMEDKMEEGELEDFTRITGTISRKPRPEFGKRPYSDGSEQDIDGPAIHPPLVSTKKHKRHHKKKSKDEKKKKKRERTRSPILPPERESKNHADGRRYEPSSVLCRDNGGTRGRHNDSRTSSRERYGRDKSRDYRHKERESSSSSRNYSIYSTSQFPNHSQRSRSRNDDSNRQSDRKSSKSYRTDSRPVSPLIKRVEVDGYGGLSRVMSDRSKLKSKATYGQKNHARSKTTSELPASYQEAATLTKSSHPRTVHELVPERRNAARSPISYSSYSAKLPMKYSSGNAVIVPDPKRNRRPAREQSLRDAEMLMLRDAAREQSSAAESSRSGASDDRKHRRKNKKSKRLRELSPSEEESDSSDEEEVEADSDEEEDSEEDSSSSGSDDDQNEEEEEVEGEGDSSTSEQTQQVQYPFRDVRSKFDSETESEEDDDGALSAEQERSAEHTSDDYHKEHALLPWYLPAKQGCRNVDEFTCLNRIEEGTYGVVYRAKEKSTNRLVALKRLKMEKEKEGFPITSLREVNTLTKANHINIVKIQEVVVGSNVDKIYIVMEYVEHDLKTLMETMPAPFLVGEVKTLIHQLLSGVRHLHDLWILHRDLKTSNLLLSHKGILKIGDFGLAREYGSPLRPYTPVVVTLWYRCPELLLGQKEYSTAVDMWSVGCILAELVQKDALFKSKSELLLLQKIYNTCGTPNEEIWPGYLELPFIKKTVDNKLPKNAHNKLRNMFGINQFDHHGITLLNNFLTYDPKMRISAQNALKSVWFYQEPRAIPPEDFPTWPAKSELALKKDKSASGSTPKAPSGGAAYSSMMEEENVFKMQKPPKEGASKYGYFSLKF